MNIQQAKTEIVNTVKAYLLKDNDGNYKIPAVRQRPVLLMGPPGIGKTQIMEQIAEECDIGLVAYTITHHTRQSAVGLPYIKEELYNGKKYSVTEYTMSEIIASVYSQIRDNGKKEGILFIDEINCVSETLTPTMLQFLQCKKFGNQAVPEGWIIVAAGNPPEYNKSVKDFDMVTLDRIRYIDVSADLDVWKTYARQNNVHGAIMSYLELRPKNFYRVEADVDGLQFVTARGWEDLSGLMKVYDEIGLKVTEEIVHEFVRNDDIAEDVAAYIELYNKYRDDYGIQNILKGNVTPSVYERVLRADYDERLSLVNLLLDALEVEFEKLNKAKKMTDEEYLRLKDYKNKQLDNSREITEQEKDINNSTNNEITTDKEYAERKNAFMDMTAALDTLQQQSVLYLEHVFDFMEDAFSKGQELLIFVTGLTMGKASALFLSENLCERYLSYNEELLTGKKKRDILNEIG